jgi:hypothetical protein
MTIGRVFGLIHWYAEEAKRVPSLTRRRRSAEIRERLVIMAGKAEIGWSESKLNRWLGFMQGVLWMTSTFSIDQLRHHVKGTPYPEDMNDANSQK